MAKRRLDELLLARGLAASEREALGLILSGAVFVSDERLTHAGASVSEDADIRITGQRPFVSRGGYKLDAALRRFGIDPIGLTAIDVGASTGGFTDVLLKRGAASVTALDVGYGQLDWSLRSDERVRTFDRTNVRTVDPVAIGAPFQLLVTDVSFIPLSVVARRLVDLVVEGADLVALVKPQFELEADAVGEGGVVRDPSAHMRAIERAVEAFAKAGAPAVSLWFSPITGPHGNIEFLLHLRKGGSAEPIDIEAVVDAAHQELGE